MRTRKLETLITNNKDTFYSELKNVIKPNFTGLDNPNKYNKIISDNLALANRDSFARQARLVCAATEYITSKKNKSLIISAEMGTGKTDLSIKISMDQKFKVNFIMCPPHLVDKWAEEIVINYKDPESYKIVKVKRWTDLVKYTKRDLREDGIKYYFIVSRESAKLGYPKQVAINKRKKYITVEQNLDGQTFMSKKLIDVATCPDCDKALLEANESGYLDLEKIPHKCDCGCVLRMVDKTKSPKLQSRVSIAEYIKRNWTKGAIDLVIADEVHEYKGGNTGQGNAFAQMCSASKKIIGLTGTLLNGYASSIFYILYRLNPSLMKDRLNFDHNEVKAFVSEFGAFDTTYEAKDIDVEGKLTKKGKQIGIPKEKPKISPYLLSVLLDMTIFLRLDEIKMEDNLGLPDYEESIELVDMDIKLEKPYMSYLSEISSRIRKDKRFLGNLANDALSIPDMPFDYHSAQNEVFYTPPFTKEDYGYTNKEIRALELIKQELSENRRVLFFIHFSNKGVAENILEILEKELPNKTIKFLKPGISANKRKKWIENNPCDVLICNPELVKTGLDLLEFPTIIFYETSYNIFTVKQASRRSWRIGQRQDVKVIFMAYRNTPQHKALELIGAKVGAANSLEGRLSGDDDLSSMSDEDDSIQVALAKSILSGDNSAKDIKLNSIKNFGNEREWDNFELHYRQMLQEKKDKITAEKLVAKQSAPVVIQESTTIDKSIDLTSKDNQTPNFTKESMMKIFAENLLRDYTSTDLYGGIDTIKDGKVYSTSYNAAYQLFEINKEYKDGTNKDDGLTISYKRDDNNYVTSIDLQQVHFHNNIPFSPKKQQAKIGIAIIEDLITQSNNDINVLQQLLMAKVYTKKINTKKQAINVEPVVFNSLLEYDGKITSETYCYYTGKGKNRKRIEIDSADLADFVPESDSKSGIQLSMF